MRIGLTCGTFDYKIHKGHISFLETCNQFCDQLYVAVVPDYIVRQNKREPYYSQAMRELNLLMTDLVYGTIGFIYGTQDELIGFNPDIYIFGKDQNDLRWNRQLMSKLINNDIAIVSTFEPRVESTTRLLAEMDYAIKHKRSYTGSKTQ